MDVSLYDRPKIAWKNKARLFVSVHCNASGLGDNPVYNNGNSVYWYQPQSQALAEAIHASYRKLIPALPDHGLYYADFAVCRMTQMPAVLTEQAFVIVPRSGSHAPRSRVPEDLRHRDRRNGIKAFVSRP